MRGAVAVAKRRSDRAAARGRGPGPGPGSAGRTRSRGASRRGPRRRSGRPARRGRPPGPTSAGHAQQRTRRGGRGRAARPAKRQRRRAAARGSSEPVVQAGQEPVRPDRAVGQVAEDAVAFAAAQRLRRAPAARSGRGGRPRAAGCRCGRGCAGTSSRRRPARRGRRRPARATCARVGAISDQPDDEHRGGQEEVELGPGGEARPRARRRRRAPTGRRPAGACSPLRRRARPRR